MLKTKKLIILIGIAIISCLVLSLTILPACEPEAGEEGEEELVEESTTEEETEETSEEVEETTENGDAEEVTEEVETEVIYEITFSSVGSPSSIYACMPDGSDRKKIYNTFDDHHPSWSNDHTKIVFSSNENDDEDYDIFIVNLIDNKVTKVVDRAGFDTLPAFDPLDENIVFCGEVGEPAESGPNYEIFTVNLDGSNLKQLTDNPLPDLYPHFSPDGETIIYTFGPFDVSQLFTMDLEGNNSAPIANGGGWRDYDGTYSPDGKNIVFVSDRGGDDDIWVMPADGSSQAVNLTNSPGYDSYPDYSPDGSMITFTSERDETEDYMADVFVMNSNGENQTNITPDLTGTYQGSPSW